DLGPACPRAPAVAPSRMLAVEYSVLAAVILVGTVVTGVFFLWRELPARRAMLEHQRAERAKQVLAAWNEEKAAEDARRRHRARRDHAARKLLEQREQRAMTAEEKMAAREEINRGRAARK